MSACRPWSWSTSCARSCRGRRAPSGACAQTCTPALTRCSSCWRTRTRAAKRSGCSRWAAAAGLHCVLDSCFVEFACGTGSQGPAVSLVGCYSFQLWPSPSCCAWVVACWLRTCQRAVRCYTLLKSPTTPCCRLSWRVRQSCWQRPAPRRTVARGRDQHQLWLACTPSSRSR